MHLLVNELCEYQNAQCNDKKKNLHLYLSISDFSIIANLRSQGSRSVGESTADRLETVRDSTS